MGVENDAGGGQMSRPIVFDFLHYRDFLNAMIEYLKSKDQYNVRDFAKTAGFGSSNYMKMILSRERCLTRKSAYKVAKAFELTEQETKFLVLLVEFNESKRFPDRDRNYRELLKFKKFRETHRAEANQFEYFSNWQIVALLEGIRTSLSLKSIQDIAQSLGISDAELKKYLSILESLQLIRKDRGKWLRLNSTVDTPVTIQSLAVRNFHREILGKAIEALDDVPALERAALSLTLALNPEKYEMLRTRLFEILHELDAVYTTSEEDAESVYQLSLALFPLVRIKR